MRNVRVLGASLILALLFSPFFVSQVNSQANTPQIDYIEAAQSVDITAIDSHLKFFTGLGSRRTATEGAEEAAKYIYSFFNSIGLSNVSYHTFPVTLPISYGANLTIIDEASIKLKIYPLAPNLVAPVAVPDLTAPILYTGDCSLQDLKGLDINGKVLLVNYNTGWNWLNALRYGAKAVIFIEPDQIILSPPTLNVPFNFPRFWISNEDATILLNLLKESQKDINVHVTSNVVWEKRLGKNVYGVVEGEDLTRFLIMSAHYDSCSHVFDLEPGANEAVGISLLLELARFFTKHKPFYNMVFVAFSGHDQSLAGSRWFAQNLLLDRPPYAERLNLPLFRKAKEDVIQQFLMALSLELTSVSPKIGLSQYDSYYTGHVNPAYPNPWEGGYTRIVRFYQYSKDLVNDMKEQIAGIDNLLFNAISAADRGNPLYERLQKFPNAFPMSDAAPFFWIPCMALTLATFDYDRALKFMHTPLDTYDTLNLANIETQAKSTFCYAYALARTTQMRERFLWQITEPVSYGGYYCNMLNGRVAEFNITSNSYESVPKAIVVWGHNSYRTPYPDYGAGPIYDLTGDDGVFGIPFTYDVYTIDAFVVNETTGQVLYAPTDGRYRWSAPTFRADDENVGIVAVFKCASVLQLDLVFPYNLRTERMDFVREILEYKSNSPTISYGSKAMTTGPSAIVLFFVPPEKAVDLIVKTSQLGKTPITVIRHVKLDAGQQYAVTLPSLTYAKELMDINLEYVNTIEQYKVQPGIPKRFSELAETIESLEEAYKNRNYEMVQSGGITAWRTAIELYIDCIAIITDAANSIPFFSLIILPFVILFEALLIASQGRKKILALVLVFTAFLLADAALHPGFFLASNSLMVVLGTNVIILTIPLLLIVLSLFHETITRLSKMIKGAHYAEVSKGTAFVTSLEFGIKNVRKRKLRTSLVLITINLIVMSSVLFSSLSTITAIQPRIQTKEHSYQGIFMKDNAWQPLTRVAVEYLRGRYSGEAKVLPRAWIYPITASDYQIYGVHAYFGNGSFNFYATLGVTPDEFWLRGALTEGRPFDASDIYACIVPDSVANKINVSVGQTLNMLGWDYLVIGIISKEKMENTLDLDGQMLTPWDQRIPLQYDMHAPVSETIIIPFQTALQYNVWISSVAIIPNNVSKTPAIAKSLFSSFIWLDVFYGFEGSTYLLDDETAFVSIGWQMQIIPLVLAALIILNVMMTSVQERVKEISTYASVGLSPLHVMGVFLAESILFGILGSTTGYLAALSIYRVALSYFEWPIPINYTSSQVTLTVVLGILITILSTIYPSYKASKMLTPSLERAWKAPTKPVDDTWEVPMPFVITEENESLAITKYIHEFVSLHSGEVEDFRVSDITLTDEPNLKKLSFTAQLAPFDAGVRQKTNVNVILDEKGWHATVSLTRISGSRGMWTRLNRTFLDHIRKQFLMWRTLPPPERQKYVSRPLQEGSKK